MAVTSKNLYGIPLRKRIDNIFSRNLAFIVQIVIVGLAALAIYVLVNTILSWGQTWLDDVRYGRPRTMHLDGFIGRTEESSGSPTHFIVLNLQRQVVVLELPGGDIKKIRSLPGPYLFGADEELTPVHIGLRDIDHDGKHDLLITARSEQVVYLNRDEAFRLPTLEEQVLLSQESAQ